MREKTFKIIQDTRNLDAPVDAFVLDEHDPYYMVGDCSNSTTIIVLGALPANKPIDSLRGMSFNKVHVSWLFARKHPEILPILVETMSGGKEKAEIIVRLPSTEQNLLCQLMIEVEQLVG